jgi:hypothetical protein
MVRRLSLRATIAGEGFERAADEELDRCGDGNVLEGLKIVRGSASKDELSAGMLAMDLAAYLKDLGDLESTLKSRLRPTISMMRMTTHALAPIVLGVTFSIYMSLSSIAGGTEDMSAGSLFLVLGVPGRDKRGRQLLRVGHRRQARARGAHVLDRLVRAGVGADIHRNGGRRVLRTTC